MWLSMVMKDQLIYLVAVHKREALKTHYILMATFMLSVPNAIESTKWNCEYTTIV